MFKMFKITIISLLLIFGASSVCYAQDITNFNDLIENGKSLDGKMITIQGEAVGDIMKRGNYSWINIGDGSNAIGIWGETSIIDSITTLGNYKRKGDVVKIQGEFHRACSEHGGDMDIHVKNISVIERGKEVSKPIDYNKVKLLVLLSLAALTAAFIYFKLRNKITTA